MKDRESIDAVLSERLAPVAQRLNESLSRRTSGPVSPNEELTINVRKFRKDYELIALAVSSWYLGDFGILLRLEIERHINSNSENAVKLRLILSSKYMMFEVLLDNYSNRDFYGNLVPMVAKQASRLSLVSNQQRPAKRIIRRRGYKDQGSLRSSDKWLETSDWSLTEKQNEIELLRQSEEDTHQFLLGLMGAI